MPSEQDLPEPPPQREPRPSGRDGRSPAAGRGRVILLSLLAVAFFLLVSLRGIAGFYTDYLWFDSLDLSAVWSRVLTTKATLSLIGGVVFFVLCWGNLLIAERIAPVFRPSSGDDDMLERYHEMIGRRAWLVRFGVALFMALIIGVSLGASWNDWILFTNRVDFGEVDATFNYDIGFYVFQLPFLISAATWLFSSLVVVFIITVLAHIVNGGIRFHTQLDRVTPQVKAHLSVLMGVLALVQVGRYWLSRYQLTFSTRGTVDGATYTDVNVELRAIYLLMLIALFAFALFIANIWRRGWVLPGMAVGLWVLVAVLAGGIVPAFVQRFRVEPTESSMEKTYIANNIAATRDAYGLGDVTTDTYDWTAKDISASTMEASTGTLDNVRLWDPNSMKDRYQEDQEIRPFYEINDVDVDRYMIDGKLTQVMIAARDLAPRGIKQPSWEATHLTYTHGYGVVAATANDQTSSGTPVLLARDVPVRSDGVLAIDQPAIYFGENKSGYVIVNTDRQEIDYQDEDGETKYKAYQGADGIEIGSGVTGFVRKSAFSLRFGDVNPMVSGNINADSKVLLGRDVTSRVKAVAPFLAYDHDPYVVVLDGKVKYVVDGYTTTRNYPNAQRADTGGLDPSSGLYGRSFNYARNSVKAVVDAYDGTVELYVVDNQDPLIKAYQKAFPELFTPGDEVPAELEEHFRYPEDLFTVQTQMWAKYHVDEADDFYNGNDEWSVPEDSGATEKSGDTNTPIGADGQKLTSGDRYPSQYVLMQLPGEEEPSFVLQRPYVTSTDDDESGGGEGQLRALIVANSDPGPNYGTLKTYTLPATDPPDGPNLAAADILANGEVAAKVKDLCTDKRVCTFAAPSILPVGNSLMYVQTFLSAANKDNAGKIEYVIVNYRRPGDQSDVKLDTTLYGALEQIFGDKVPTSVQGGDQQSEPTETDPGDPADPAEEPTGTLSERESQLIDRLVKAFDEADAAARKGDQVTYAERITEAGRLATQLQSIREQAESEQVEDGDTATTTTTDPATTTTTSAGT
jgi:uncharacterized membrane protein (UPF0182 family)